MLKHFSNIVVRPVLGRYLASERPFTYKGFRLRILPGVFHPGFFFSTKVLFRFLQGLELSNKTFLEIGCGSGMLSLLASSKQALVTAIDISPTAVRNTKDNFSRNQQLVRKEYQVFVSDLFEQMNPATQFDYIVINPPYFFKTVETEAQHAWYCGEDGNYFQRLFSGIGQYTHPGTNIYMILADNCDIPRIEAIALRNGSKLHLEKTVKTLWEKNFIYKLVPINA